MATNRAALENSLSEPLTLAIRKISSARFTTKGINLKEDRLNLYWLADNIVQGILHIATEEEEVYDYPADWWQAFKDRWFPAWLKKRSPVRRARVWAIHKFPEVNIPEEFLGREFVHFRVIDSDKLLKQ